MSVSETKVSSSSDYTFELDISTKVPAGGQIRINLDASYGLTAGAIISCTGKYGFTSATTCTVDTDGRTIVTTGAFPTTDFLLILTIEGL